MTTEMRAGYCVAYVQDGVVYVGFCDSEFDTQEYLLLQRSLTPDPQDAELGFDAVHITYCDQDRSAYGGVLQFVLTEGSAEILLDPETAEVLGTAERVQIHLPSDGLPMSTLREHLQQIFGEADGVLTFE